VAWLAPPELEVGAEPELKPPEPELELLELEPVELEPELVELEPVELEPELELAEEEFDEPVEVEPDPPDVPVLCVVPGKARPGRRPSPRWPS